MECNHLEHGDLLMSGALLDSFVDLHRSQLELSGVPRVFYPILFDKLQKQIFDAGEYFGIIEVENDEGETVQRKVRVTSECNILKDDPSMIFLIDHAYTYRINTIRNELEQLPELVERLSRLMFISSDAENKINAIIEHMWKFNHTYTLAVDGGDAEDREPYWYIRDEFGSAVEHCDQANVRMAPFLSMIDGQMYTLLWLIKDIECNESVSVDYVCGTQDELIRRAKLVPWTAADLSDDIDYQQTEPNEQYFNTGRESEKLPSSETYSMVDLTKLNRTINVLTDVELVRDNLADKRFQLVEDLSHADIIFTRKHFKDFKNLCENTQQFINQYPFENIINIKDLLAIICRRTSSSIDKETLQSYPLWLPTTFNLTYELPKLISYFQHREKKNLDNHWIVKPFNLARSIDTHVTKNLNSIIRLAESGPKIVCKYIDKPLLFHREESGLVKFDIRYIVLLRSLEPLKVYVYEKFWLRFANKPYSLDNNYDDYQVHFTVMNYRYAQNLKKITCEEFVPLFDEQQQNLKWADVQENIFSMIHQVFERATMRKPPCGMLPCHRSRAVYAVDLMLDQTGQPYLLEMNFMPDIERACSYYPTFMDDIFRTLFLDESNSNVIDISSK
ncbi:unnamed protein product [Rotaria socialis]|uniref:Tubulin--tyrosine ligase-like protein 12 SET-like domain-containing protein n=1 Tax=Rotaria socialis TaxID=392032 RepID=A0A817R9A2_9BILA|nr:unnamed protein product [Rotaria socialis]CAF3245621.1 unnamed protein product [Rotaria socialis]CAF3333039.1 unnamed protein product [Rotaria socialis]CAF3553311.1 unnamed protein product [Rotaria socialis]CAF3761890.1 unnamed protein product [Rotaria socialis]